MTQTLDIMERLTRHIAAARKLDGMPCVMSDGYYGQSLRGMRAEERESIIAHCASHGCGAVYVNTPLGGVSLCMTGRNADKSKSRNAETGNTKADHRTDGTNGIDGRLKLHNG